jgi:hypothetical protein
MMGWGATGWWDDASFAANRWYDIDGFGLLHSQQREGKARMRRLTRQTLTAAAVVAAVLGLGLGTEEVHAQGPAAGGYSGSYRVSDYLGSPGSYGMSYGFASYGMPQTYSVFSAMPGPSYGTTYPPYGLMPGKYGVGLWRPGFVAPGYVYGASYYYPASSDSYRTFSVGNRAGSQAASPPPPVGVYAPALGPRTMYGW